MAKPKQTKTKKKVEATSITDDKGDQLEVIDGELTSADFAYRTINTVYKLLERITKEDGTFSPKYSVSLRLLADSIWHYAKTNREASKTEVIYMSSGEGGDMPKLHPIFAARDTALKQVNILLKSHGLDPASASKITKDESDSKTQLTEIFAKLMGGGELESDFK